MKVALLGATGFVGSALLNEAHDRKHLVSSSNRSPFQIAPAHRPVGAQQNRKCLQGGRQGTNLPKQAHPVLHMTRHGDSSFLEDVEFMQRQCYVLA